MILIIILMSMSELGRGRPPLSAVQASAWWPSSYQASLGTLQQSHLPINIIFTDQLL